MKNFKLRLVIVIFKLVTWMKGLDIWINKSNYSEFGWISTSESLIITKTKLFLWGSFRLEYQKSLRVWFTRKKWLAQIFFKLKSSAIAFRFCLMFSLFNDHFPLFILASVAANHKIATDSDLLNNIAGVLKYAHDKTGVGFVER